MNEEFLQNCKASLQNLILLQYFYNKIQQQMKASSMPIQTSDNKILITVKAKGVLSSLFSSKRQAISIYVPKDFSIHQLKNFLTTKISMNQKDSFFIFAYGYVVNNNERIGEIYQKFKSKVTPGGVQLQITQMSTFGTIQ